MKTLAWIAFAWLSTQAWASDSQVIRLHGAISTAFLIQDESTLVARFDDHLNFVDLSTGQRGWTVELPPLDYNFPMFAQGDYAIFLACDLNPDSDCDRRWSPHALLVDLSKGERAATFKAEGNGIFTGAGVSPDGRYAVLLASEGGLTFIDPKTGKILRKVNAPSLKGGYAPLLKISSDAQFVAYSLRNQESSADYVRVARADTGKEVALLQKKTTYSFEFSADSRFLIAGDTQNSAGNDSVAILDLSTGAVTAEAPETATGLVSPNGETFYAVGRSGLKAYDLATGKLSWTIPDGRFKYAVVSGVSASGNLLYLEGSWFFGSRTSYVVDLAEREILRTLKGTDGRIYGGFLQGEENLLLSAHQNRSGKHNCEITRETGSSGGVLSELVIPNADGDFNDGCAEGFCWNGWRSACGAFQAPKTHKIVAYGVSQGVSQIHLLQTLPDAR